MRTAPTARGGSAPAGKPQLRSASAGPNSGVGRGGPHPFNGLPRAEFPAAALATAAAALALSAACMTGCAGSGLAPLGDGATGPDSAARPAASEAAAAPATPSPAPPADPDLAESSGPDALRPVETAVAAREGGAPAGTVRGGQDRDGDARVSAVREDAAAPGAASVSDADDLAARGDGRPSPSVADGPAPPAAETAAPEASEEGGGGVGGWVVGLLIAALVAGGGWFALQPAWVKRRAWRRLRAAPGRLIERLRRRLRGETPEGTTTTSTLSVVSPLVVSRLPREREDAPPRPGYSTWREPLEGDGADEPGDDIPGEAASVEEGAGAEVFFSRLGSDAPAAPAKRATGRRKKGITNATLPSMRVPGSGGDTGATE